MNDEAHMWEWGGCQSVKETNHFPDQVLDQFGAGYGLSYLVIKIPPYYRQSC